MSSRKNSVFFEDMSFIQKNLERNVHIMSWSGAEKIKLSEVKSYILKHKEILLAIKERRDECKRTRKNS